MTTGQRTAVALLAVVAVLLGLNLLNAQPRLAAAAGAPVKLVSATVDKDIQTTSFVTYRVFRGWDDGRVDVTWARIASTFGNECVIVEQCGPVTITP